MPYQIRVRRDVLNTWNTNDPILGEGEIGFATDTKEIRIGDGVSTWTALTPIQASGDAISIDGKPIEAGPPQNGEVLQYNNVTQEWEYTTLSGLGGNTLSTDTLWNAKGDLVVGTGDNQANILPVGATNGHVLKVDSSTATGLAWGAASGSGTVTSVSLTMPTSIFDVAGSPINSSGTLAVTLDNQNGNTVFAGPTSNSLSAPPTFRNLVAADIPNISTETGPLGAALVSITSATNEVGSGADQILYLSGAKSFARTTLTSTARTLLADTSTTAMRSTLGLAINTDVQAYDAGLQSIAGLTTAADKMLYTTALDTYAVTTLTQFGRSLIDDADAEIARTTLGFKTAVGVATAPQAETTVKYVRAAQASLTKGMVVYVSGSNGNNLNVSKAQADAESTSSKTVGLLLQNFTNVGDLGYAVTEGLIEGLDTNGLTPGAAVWLSPTTAGGWTTTKPTAPNHLVFLGWIVKDNASTGSIYVKVSNGQELDELHDVQISSSANNDILQYDNTVSPPVWKNRTLANAGIATSSHTHGNITNAGAINSTANLPLITTTGGVITTGSFGTTANTFCQGNDSRLDLQTITLTGNVTGSGTGSFATTIATGVITPSMFSTAGATSGDVIKYNGTAWALAQDATGSGSGTPGGSDTQVQFNDGGNFGGDSGLTYNKTTDTLTITGDLNVNGGELESSAATFNLLAVPSTVNLGAVATIVNIGNADNETNAGAATVKLLGGTLVGSLAEQNIFNTVATTGNILGAATSITMGATTGTATLRNATVTLSNATTLNINGASPTLASSSTGTLSLFNTNLLTVNAFGAATSLSIANTSTSSQTVNLASSTTSSVSSKILNIGSNGASGSSTSINIGTGSSGTVSVTLGSASGTHTINGLSTTLANSGELRFAETSGGNYVGFKADNTIDSNLIWTLPKVDGSANQVLSTNGSGVLSWATAGTAGGTKTYAVFTPLDNQPPAANYATLDTVNTTSPIAVLDFNDGTDEYAIFVGIMPEGSTFTSGLKIILFWTGDTTSTNSVVWSAEIENDEGYDIDTDGWDTNTVSTTTAHNGVAGQINKTIITLGSGDVDGIAAGQPYRLRVFRDANNGSDNYVGDAMLMAVEVRNGA